MPNRYVLFILGLLLCSYAHAQEDTVMAAETGNKYLAQVADKADDLENKLDKKSQQLIRTFRKEENRLQRKLARKDPAAAAVFAGGDTRYAQLQDQLNNAGRLQHYIPSLDTLSSSLKFLEKYPQLMTASKDGAGKLNTAMTNIKGLESRLQQAEVIKQFLKERRQYLKDQLGRLGMTKDLARLNKQAYYYNAQVNEYKALLKDHKKAEQKALQLLGDTKLFKDFMRKNSMLASLFRMPSDPDDPSSPVSLAGLQTRVQVNNLVQQQIAAGGPNAQAQFSQNMQQAQSKLNELKSKLNKPGNGGSNEPDLPEGFKPNHQKTKSFFQRVELGANIQSQKSNSFFPVTSDLALTAGYKLNDKSIIGIGAGYKLGWGQNIRNIKITHEGVSLRSFIDIKLKGSFWMTGGYEMNYRESFHRIAQLKDRSGWQESGLIGVSKVIDLRSKLLKKTKVQLLWDLLSYGKTPKAAAVLFRVGYSF